MEQARYHWTLRGLHWLMAILILGLIALGWWMHGLEQQHPQRGWIYGLHKSFGVIVLLLVAVRLAVRALSTAPSLPEALSPAEKTGAHAAHLLLYAGMLAVPLSGLTMSMAEGYGVNLFGYPLPNPLSEDKALAGQAHTLHGILPYALLAVIALHAAGALKHRLFDSPERDVLYRMGWPRRHSASTSQD